MQAADITNIVETAFAAIEFDPQWHTYKLNGQRLQSVTKTIGQLKKPFDKEYWANKKAAERGVEPQVILAEWEAKGKASIERGNRVHEHIETVLLGQPVADDPFLMMNDRLPELDAFDKFWEKARVTMAAAAVEWVVGDAALGLAGTCDTMFMSYKTNQLHIFDWKTGSKFETVNKFGRLAAPFDDLEECQLTIYSLQVSLYRLMIERNTGLALGDSYIVYLSGNQYTIHKALDLRERLEAWLTDGQRPAAAD